MIQVIQHHSITYYTALSLLTGFFLAACNSTEQQDSRYIRQINQWHQQRISDLNEDDSWLSLAGLYPLRNGEHTFGADSSNDIIFPPEKAPDQMGSFIVEGDDIRVTIRTEVDVQHNGKTIQQKQLQSDASGEPTVLTHSSLQWYVIERGVEYFVRLKDTKHSRLATFDGIERFPVTRDWRVRATFVPFKSVDAISVPNVLDQTNKEPLYGRLQFTIDGQQYSLAPEGDPEGDEFFIVFGDATNGESTYGGGRFVYVDTPDENGTTYLDFNKAYNPPCVFTPYSTCPLPPAQNRLPIKITAGEKMWEHGVKH